MPARALAAFRDRRLAELPPLASDDELLLWGLTIAGAPRRAEPLRAARPSPPPGTRIKLRRRTTS